MYDLIDRRIDHLDEGGRFVLWAMRAWTSAIGERRCGPGALAEVFLRAGAIDALPNFHRLLATLNREGRLTLSLAPLRCPQVAEDEAMLLALWRHALGDARRARGTLDLLVVEAAVAPAFESLLIAAQRLAAAGFAPRGLASVEARER